MLGYRAADPVNPIIEVKKLTKVFGTGRRRITAVDGISFGLGEGEVVSLLGESGSGKSTVARLLLRLLPPTEGEILFRGQNVLALRRRKELLSYWRQVQAIFQDPFASFNMFYRVRRVLSQAFNILEQLPDPEEKDRLIHQALERVGLNPRDVLDKRPFELSGGQRQRIMVARALVVKPRVLIADEPTSMIDASSRASILNLLLQLQKDLGMTILFITHDIGLAYYTSDRLLVMHRGRIVEEGSADQVVERPQHEYTRRLLADVPRLHEEWAL